MKGALKFLGFLVAVVVALAMIGASMEPRHTITRSMSFAAPADKVWSALLSIRQLPFDRSDLRTVDQGTSTPTPDSIEVIGGPVAITFEEFRPPRDFTVKTVDPDLPYSGTWTFVLTPESHDLTKLTVTEDAWVRGRLLRFGARALGGDDLILDGIFRAVKRKIVEGPRT